MIKHLSLDFWGTIGIANPNFAQLRSEILSEFSETYLNDWGTHRHSPEYCRQAYSYVKNYLEGMEKGGTHYSTDVCYEALMNHLEVKLPYHRMVMMKARIWEAFYNNPPTILHETITELRRLQDKGYTLAIGSNTNFIPGAVIIDAVLKELNLFDLYIFSDAVGCSKPSHHFFDKVSCLPFHDLLHSKEILHIGDSQVFDYDGAIKYGLSAHLISDPADLIEYLKTL